MNLPLFHLIVDSSRKTVSGGEPVDYVDGNEDVIF